MIEWIVLLLVPSAALLMTIFNLLTWSRGSANGPELRDVAILIPARNAAKTVSEAIESALELDPHASGLVTAVVVYDDGSTDETARLVRKWAEKDRRVHLLEGGDLPEGWVGKPHACHRLYLASSAEILLFVDADVRLRKGALSRLGAIFLDDRRSIDVVTAVPRQEMKSFVETLVLPLLHLTYTAWLPLIMVSRGRSPSTVAANGQVLLLRRTTCDALGGFGGVRSEIVDDVAFCRRAKIQGFRVEFADGFHMATCRMYEGARQVWAGFSKNLFEGLGGRSLLLLAVVALYFFSFVFPYGALLVAVAIDAPWIDAALGGVIVNLLLRLMLAVRFRHSLTSVVAHPLGVLVLLAIALNSFWWVRRGRIEWAGRSYGPRKGRMDAGVPFAAPSNRSSVAWGGQKP